MGGLFDSKKTTVTQEPMMPDWQLATGKQLSDWIQKYMDQYQPGAAYTGKLSAGMSSQEQTGQSLLDQFLAGKGIGDLFAQGKQQISDTLAGKYADPNTSPFIQSMKQVSAQDLADAINASRRGSGARGKFFSTASGQEEGDLANRNLQNLNSIIGQFTQQERQNMLGAVPQATAMDQYENQTVPLSKIQAASTFGSLSRTLEQADLERQYNEFVRQRTEMSGPVSAAQSLYQTQVPYGVKSITTESPSTFMKMMGEISPTIGSYNTQKYGYDVNQASLSNFMSAFNKIMSSGGFG
jgi:hypothetical protein